MSLDILIGWEPVSTICRDHLDGQNLSFKEESSINLIGTAARSILIVYFIHFNPKWEKNLLWMTPKTLNQILKRAFVKAKFRWIQELHFFLNCEEKSFVVEVEATQ